MDIWTLQTHADIRQEKIVDGGTIIPRPESTTSRQECLLYFVTLEHILKWIKRALGSRLDHVEDRITTSANQRPELYFRGYTAS